MSTVNQKRSPLNGLPTCVAPSGEFVFGVHQPAFSVANLRENDAIFDLGRSADTGGPVRNKGNFPPQDVNVSEADWIFEIPNAFPFRGATYIVKRWADKNAGAPDRIGLAPRSALSLSDTLKLWRKDRALSKAEKKRFFDILPEPLQLAVATCSTDPDDLVFLADNCCDLLYDQASGCPVGLVYEQDDSDHPRAKIHNMELFDAVANNPHLPDTYKTVMVLRPGVQGGSEIVGEWLADEGKSHVYEYMRRNSYIPWGHYAANMAHDCVRYNIASLSHTDWQGLRHLYYQRTYVRLAQDLGLDYPKGRRTLDNDQLERLRALILDAVGRAMGAVAPPFNATLWGWNFGYDFAPSKYRLHASHQQIHQQYALVPSAFTPLDGVDDKATTLRPYACGDLVDRFTRQYRDQTGRSFFECYLEAIRSNRRTDGRPAGDHSLIVYENEDFVAFVPKAQTSQWELQIMPVSNTGSILDMNRRMRYHLDSAIRAVLTALTSLGARMVTGSEYSRRFDSDNLDQRVLYTFLPRLPHSPGAFSESQLRWINNHYPEDFASACRAKLGG